MASILIVDDDRDILRMMEFALKRAEHDPITTASAKEALETIKTSPPQLVIVDIMMPEMTGYDFTRQVREMPNRADLPILIYSARFQPIDRQTALEAGATAYMPKNVAPPEIIQKVNELLGPSNQTATRQGQTIACFSLKGGVGVTTILANLAVIIALTQKTSVCLTDLNPLAGHAGLLMNLRPQANLQNLLTNVAPSITPDLVKKHLTPHKTGVQLLASPLMPKDQKANHTIQELTQVLQTGFRFSLLDLPHRLDSDQTDLLASLDKLVLLISPDVPALQSAVTATRYLAQHDLPTEKILPVLNYASPIAGLPEEAIKKTIRQPLAATIPFDKGMGDAIKAGQPLVLHNPKSPTSMALAKLASKLLQ